LIHHNIKHELEFNKSTNQSTNRITKMSATDVMREHTSRSLISLISPDHFDPADRVGSQKTYRVPEHQRYPSWSSLKKERLVDSVMANWIIGQITLTKHHDQSGDEYFNVQDGQTRMGALQEYVMDKFPWNGKLYSELTAEERARFNNYTVQLDIFKKERNMSQSEFNRVICEIFERLNSGTPLTDNDKYWNRSDTPTMKLLNQLKCSAEFGPLIRKYMWLNVGGGKGRSGLNHFVGLILGLVNQRAECISTSFMQNGRTLMETIVDEAGERRVTDFLRWYFGLLTDVFQFASWSVKRTFGKLSGVCGMIAVDWINSNAGARGHYAIWKRCIELQFSRAHFERRLFAELPNGHARNVTEIAINARIDAVMKAYETDVFAEYSQDAFNIILGSDDESDDS
jgi:hypothetical protein